MGNRPGKVVLITGTSSGIGQACALHLTQQGYRVYGTSRQANPARRGQAPLFELLQMDVDDEASVQAGINRIMQKEGRLDGVVNNAGFRLAGAVEDTTVAEAKAQFETSFFGVLRVCRAVLPIMRQQQSGHIINISSIAGLIAVPFQSMYSAAKYAVEGLIESLRMEVSPLGIRVVLVEPGDFHTQLTINSRKTAASQQNPAYADKFNRAVGVMEHDETHGPSPDQIAPLVERILNHPRPRLRYVVGPAYESVALGLKRVLPAGWFELGLMKYYKL